MKLKHTYMGLSLGFLVLLAFTSCQMGRGQSWSQKMRDPRYIPPYIDETQAQQEYLLLHYWDAYSLDDSLVLNHPEMYEGLLADYLGLLISLDPAKYQKEIVRPLEMLEGEALTKTLDLYRQYLYEAESSLASDDTFRPVLEWCKTSPKVPTSYQMGAEAMLTLINRNRVGTIATDFVYETPEGKLRKLSRFDAPYTLLIFGTEGCGSCRASLDYILRTPIYSQLADRGKLRLLHLLVQREQNAPLLPVDTLHSWIETGGDHEGKILQGQLYDIKISPTIYLLDKDKNILLKDAKLEGVTRYLEHLPLD